MELEFREEQQHCCEQHCMLRVLVVRVQSDCGVVFFIIWLEPYRGAQVKSNE